MKQPKSGNIRIFYLILGLIFPLNFRTFRFQVSKITQLTDLLNLVHSSYNYIHAYIHTYMHEAMEQSSP
jgi:hypothetical protein